MTDDALMTGFVRLKSLLMEAQERFGPELGVRVVALAKRMQKKAETHVTTEECYRYLVELHEGDPRVWAAIEAEL